MDPSLNYTADFANCLKHQMYKKKRNVPYGCDGKRLLFSDDIISIQYTNRQSRGSSSSTLERGDLNPRGTEGVGTSNNKRRNQQKKIVAVALSEKNSHNNNWLSLSLVLFGVGREDQCVHVYIYI